MFSGFSQATGDFLWGLSMNNDREWFNAHRDEYEAHLNGPFRALALETLALLQQRFPEQDFQVHIARIWRDARRLFGRGPFKDHLWFSIQSGDRHAKGPMFWFELDPTGWSYGVGNWEDAADVGAAWRALIDADPARFEGPLQAMGRDLQAPQGGSRRIPEPLVQPPPRLRGPGAGLRRRDVHPRAAPIPGGPLRRIDAPVQVFAGGLEQRADRAGGAVG